MRPMGMVGEHSPELDIANLSSYYRKLETKHFQFGKQKKMEELVLQAMR